MMIDKTTLNEIKKIIFRYLNPKEYQVFIFGSRATGEAVKFSDIDIGIMAKKEVDGETLAKIESAFEDSDIPYKVEVVDFSLVSKRFKRVALKKIISLS
jgi:predicted nucleotidyltransferase